MKALFLFCLIICTAEERAISGEVYQPKLKIQKPFFSEKTRYSTTCNLISFSLKHVEEITK